MPLFPEFPAASGPEKRPEKKRSFFKRAGRFFVFFFCFIGILFSSAVGWRVYSLANNRLPQTFAPGTVLRLNLENELFETRPNDFIGSLTFGNPPTAADVILGLNRAAADPNISGLVAYMTKMSLPLAQIQEIRSAVRAFKKAGKKTVFYAPTIGELGGGLGMYYLASAFDEIRIQPGGEVGLAGIAVETPYFKKALLKLGIQPSFNARYEYKTGADSLNAEKMSAPEKENLTRIFNSFLDVMAADIAQDRPVLKKSEIKQILQNGPYFADQALKMKLIDKVEYADVLEEELKQAKTLLYITDNCGEIVLDKIFIEELKKRYGNLEITVMVRGGLEINDATIEDAQEIGLTKIVPVISNGAAIAGTVKEQLSKEARKQLDSADVIIAKGMGNFESMYQEGINPYYLFLCKCDLFTRRFGVKLFDPIFCKEERLDIK